MAMPIHMNWHCHALVSILILTNTPEPNMWKICVHNEQRWLRNRALYGKGSFFSQKMDRAVAMISCYKVVRMDEQRFKGTERHDIFCAIQYLIKIANQCRRYLFDMGDMKKINSAIKDIKDVYIFWIFRNAFNPYCGAFDIVETKIEPSEGCMVKELANERYLYYERLTHDLIYYRSDIKAFVPSKRFNSYKYREKCRRNLAFINTWEITDII